MNTNICPVKKQKQFECKNCNFICSKSSNYNSHLLTAKHLLAINSENSVNDTNITTNANIENKIFTCKCGKEYKFLSSLCFHKKKCNYLDIVVENKKEDATEVIIPNNVIMKIIEANKDLKDIIINQQQQHYEQQEKQKREAYEQQEKHKREAYEQQEKNKLEAYQQQEKMMEMMTKQISEIIPKMGNNNNNTNKITNNTKNKFNLKIFLNETCKEAISIKEFMSRFEVSMQNIILLKDKGLIESVTQAFIDNINKLDINERPIHCTDKKRERLYVKNDTWQLDEDNTQIKTLLRQMNHRQLQETEQWTDANPDYMTEDELQNEFVKLIGNCTTTFYDKEGKIIRNICEHVYLTERH